MDAVGSRRDRYAGCLFILVAVGATPRAVRAEQLWHSMVYSMQGAWRYSRKQYFPLHSGIEVLVPWYVVGHGFYAIEDLLSSYQVPTHAPLVLPDGEVLHSIRGCGGEAEGG